MEFADDGPVHGHSQHQQEFAEAVRALQLRIFEPEASGLVVGEYGLNSPSQAVIEHGDAERGGGIHGDEPEIVMPFLVQISVLCC